MKIRFTIGIGHSFPVGIIEAEAILPYTPSELKLATSYLKKLDNHRDSIERLDAIRGRPTYAPQGCPSAYLSKGCIFLRNLRLIQHLHANREPQFPGVSYLLRSAVVSIKLNVVPEYNSGAEVMGRAAASLVYGDFNCYLGSWDVDASSISIVFNGFPQLLGSVKYKLKA